MSQAYKGQDIISDNLSNLRRNGIFIVLLMGCIVCAFVQTALSVALVPIMSEMKVAASVAQWLTSTYSLVMGIMVLAAAFLIRRFPAKPLFLVDMAIFMAGLLLSAVADDFYMLLAGRLLQAVACGILLSLTQVVVLTIYPKNRLGTVMGTFGLAVTAAPVLAPTLAGVMIDLASWRLIFWISLGLSAVILVSGIFLMANVTATQKQRFDFLSMLLCSVGLTGLLIGLGQFGNYPLTHIQVWLPIISSILASTLFVIRQKKLDKPLIDLRIFSNLAYRLAVIASMVMYAVLLAGATLVPLYMQSLRGFSATQAGLLTMPGALVTACCSLIAGRLYDRIGIRKIALGGTLFLFLGSVGFIFLGQNTPIAWLVIFFIIRQIGVGVLMMPIFTWGMSKIPKSHYADGTAMLSSLRTAAGALGAAGFVSAMTVAAGMRVPSDMFLGMQAAFALMAVLALALLLLAIFRIGKADH